jgi:hypothetical protein
MLRPEQAEAQERARLYLRSLMQASRLGRPRHPEQLRPLAPTSPFLERFLRQLAAAQKRSQEQRSGSE